MLSQNRLSSMSVILSATAMLSIATPQIAYADDLPILQTECDPEDNFGGPTAPENAEPSPGGVDMQSGQFLYTHTDLSAGDPNAPSLIRHFLPLDGYGVRKEGSFNNLGHNWDITLEQDRKQVCYANTPAEYDYYIEINVGPRTHTFRADYTASSWGDFLPLSGGDFKWLDFGPNGGRVYTLHLNDGTTYQFEPTSTPYYTVVRASKITQPDGTVYDLIYNTNLRHVVSNRGYALGFDYTTSGTETVVSKACLINLAYHTLPSSGSACPSGVKTATYSYSSGDLVSYTDQTGVATTIDMVGQQRLYHPGQSTPYLTNNLGTGNNSTKVVSQTFADGRTFSYLWTLQTAGYNGGVPQVLTSKYTDADNKSVTYKYGEYQREGDQTNYTTPGPIEVTDQLNRKTIYHYNLCSNWSCDPNKLLYVQDPLGNRREFTYGTYGNVTEVRRTDRTGSSLPDLVETRTYGCGMTTPGCMAKPNSVTDPSGNITSFSFATGSHGGETLATQPAVNGVSPKVRTSYTQRYAWVDNGSGGATQAGGQIYVVNWTKTCRTSNWVDDTTECAGGSSDRVMTEYLYGANNGTEKHNLMPKGIKVTADGQSLYTCFQYDEYGNKIAETKPEAGLTSCS